MIIYKENSQIINNIFTENYDVILFSMGINNTMNKGFPYELSVNFPEIKYNENKQPYCDKRKLGTIYKHHINGKIFCSCYVHCGGYHKNENNEFIEYDKLIECLKKVNEDFKGKKIATYYIGCSEYDGNGDRNKVEDLIKKYLNDCEVYLYINNPLDIKLEIFKKIAELRKEKLEKKIDNEIYSKERSKLEWIRKNGIYKEMPINYKYIPKKINRKNIRFIGKIEK